jgi:hypothetical protein
MDWRPLESCQEEEIEEFILLKCPVVRVSIADPILKPGYIYSSNKKGVWVGILLDIGAQVNLIS